MLQSRVCICMYTEYVCIYMYEYTHGVHPCNSEMYTYIYICTQIYIHTVIDTHTYVFMHTHIILFLKML